MSSQDIATSSKQTRPGLTKEFDGIEYHGNFFSSKNVHNDLAPKFWNYDKILES